MVGKRGCSEPSPQISLNASLPKAKLSEPSATVRIRFCPSVGVATAWPSFLRGADSAARPVCCSLRGMVNIWPVSVLLHKRTVLLTGDKSMKGLSEARVQFVFCEGFFEKQPRVRAVKAEFGSRYAGGGSPNCPLPAGWPLTSNFSVPISSLANEGDDTYLVSLW